MRVWIGALLALLPATASAAEAPARLVFAAPPRAGEEWPPRRLFNAGLEAEERGNLVMACQLYLAARLSGRAALADELYARGAALRLVRILLGYDDDAAVAAALLAAPATEGSDLAPVVKGLIRRLERGSEKNEKSLELLSGILLSVRFQRSSGQVFLELEPDNGERRIIVAESPVGPFSAGQRVKMLIQKLRGNANAGWRLLALAGDHADGWQIIRVRGLPGSPTPADGELLGEREQMARRFLKPATPAATSNRAIPFLVVQ
jgi:hypothetical protein